MFQQTSVLFQLAPRDGLFETVDKVSVKSHLNSDANNIEIRRKWNEMNRALGHFCAHTG